MICQKPLSSSFLFRDKRNSPISKRDLIWKRFYLGKKLKNALYDKIEDKGFKYLKDYLYYLYIEKKEENNIISKIDDINELIKNSPNLLDFHESLKICRFIAFTTYLIKEIINYTNSMKDIYELKIRAKNFYDIVSSKIDKIQNKNMKQKQKQK